MTQFEIQLNITKQQWLNSLKDHSFTEAQRKAYEKIYDNEFIKYKKEMKLRKQYAKCLLQNTVIQTEFNPNQLIDFKHLTSHDKKLILERELIHAKNKKGIYKLIDSLHICNSYEYIFRNPRLRDSVDAIEIAIDEIDLIHNDKHISATTFNENVFDDSSESVGESVGESGSESGSESESSSDDSSDSGSSSDDSSDSEKDFDISKKIPDNIVYQINASTDL